MSDVNLTIKQLEDWPAHTALVGGRTVFANVGGRSPHWVNQCMMTQAGVRTLTKMLQDLAERGKHAEQGDKASDGTA